MKVRCLANNLTDSQIKALGIENLYAPTYQLTVGKIYNVLSLTVLVRSSIYGSGIVVDIVEDGHKFCVSIPLCLFEITDPRPSSFWIAKTDLDFSLTLWPLEFYSKFFHDDLTDGIEDVQKVFDSVVKKIEQEFEGISPDNINKSLAANLAKDRTPTVHKFYKALGS